MIHAAIEQKNLSALTAALAAKADPNELDAKGFCALEKAAGLGTPEMLEALLEAGADPLRAKTSVLGTAVRRRSSKMVALLLAKKVDPNHTNTPELLPMAWALRWSAAVALELLEHGATLPAALAPFVAGVDGSAAEKKKLIELAIARTDDPSALLRALLSSTANELPQWVAQLVHKGAQLRPDGAPTLLHVAARETHVNAVRALIAAGASVDDALTTDWVDFDDEGEHVIARAGTSVRELFSSFYRDEVASLAKHPHPERRARLDKTLAALGLDAPVVPQRPFGRWVETARESVTADDPPTTTPVSSGGELRWNEDGSYSVTGALGCGLEGHGQLKLDGARLTVRRPKAKALSGTVQGTSLRISSEPDEEHGLIVTSVFRLASTASPAAPKAAAKKSPGKTPAAKKAPSKTSSPAKKAPAKKRGAAR